jgi:hypothetical protein
MCAVFWLLVTSVLKNGYSGATLVPSHTSEDNSLHCYDCQNLSPYAVDSYSTAKVLCLYGNHILIIVLKDTAVRHNEQVSVTSGSAAFESWTGCQLL